MSWDIYGNPLRRGYCEVHPHVAESYPCSLCDIDHERFSNEQRIMQEAEVEWQRGVEHHHRCSIAESISRKYRILLWIGKYVGNLNKWIINEQNKIINDIEL